MMAYQYMIGNPHVQQDGYMIAAIDARMGQWYWGVYQTFKDRMPIRADAIALSEPSLIQAQSTNLVLGHQLTLGEELDSYLQIISGEVSPHALGVASLALQADLSGSFLAKDCQPLYIRDKIAQTILERSTPGL
jgi:tRNA threonylcarbamoyladenosine biosynthesis protein TsaB